MQVDDMDAHLERYKPFAIRKEWRVGDWAVSLNPLITRKGLQIYSVMPPGNANNYKKLETALMQWYELTEDGFHRKFRENQPEVGETFSACNTAKEIFHKMD